MKYTVTLRRTTSTEYRVEVETYDEDGARMAGVDLLNAGDPRVEETCSRTEEPEILSITRVKTETELLRERLHERLIGIDELERRIKLPPTKIRALVKKGEIPYIQVGFDGCDEVVFDEEEIERWLEASSVKERGSGGSRS